MRLLFKFFLVLFFFIGPIQFSVAQNIPKDSTLKVFSHWKMGDSKKYSYKERTQKFKNDTITHDNELNSIIELSVVDSSLNSYSIDWKIISFKANGALVGDPILTGVLESTPDLIIKYRTDKSGNFFELINWKELQVLIYNLIDQVELESSDGEYNDYLTKYRNQYSTKEGIEKAITKNIQFFHTPLGVYYPLYSKKCSDRLLYLPIPTEPVASSLCIETLVLNLEKNFCEVKYELIPNKEEMLTRYIDWLQPQVENGKIIDLKEMQFSDNSNYKLELSSGWIINAYRAVKVEVLTSRKEVTTKFSLLE